MTREEGREPREHASAPTRPVFRRCYFFSEGAGALSSPRATRPTASRASFKASSGFAHARSTTHTRALDHVRIHRRRDTRRLLARASQRRCPLRRRLGRRREGQAQGPARRRVRQLGDHREDRRSGAEADPRAQAEESLRGLGGRPGARRRRRRFHARRHHLAQLQRRTDQAAGEAEVGDRIVRAAADGRRDGHQIPAGPRRRARRRPLTSRSRPGFTRVRCRLGNGDNAPSVYLRALPEREIVARARIPLANTGVFFALRLEVPAPVHHGGRRRG